MNQEQRLNYLLNYLLQEKEEYKNIEISDNFKENRKLLRGLLNVRLPHKVSDEFLKVQDQFLSDENKEKGIVTINEIETINDQFKTNYDFGEQLSIWQGDITRLGVGAIVNAANNQLLGCFNALHNCIDNVIHTASGVQLRDACNLIMIEKRAEQGLNYVEPTGDAKLTSGYNLPSDYVIHTVGPIVYGKLNEQLETDLRNSYFNSLELARRHNIDSIAFCCISTGEFHFPNRKAARIAIDTVRAYLNEYPSSFKRVIFNVFKDIDLDIYNEEIQTFKKEA